MDEIIKEHIKFKKQIMKLAIFNLKKSYKGSVLGIFWIVAKPICIIFIYWFAFAIGLKVSKEMYGFPYFMWLISGIIPWFYIQEILNIGTESIRKYEYLVTKMKFPISTIPTFVSLSTLIVHLILIFVCFAIWLYNNSLSIYILQLPLYIVFNFLFSTVICLLFSILSAISKDILNLIKSSIFALFWLSGILWDINNLNSPTLIKIFKLNPINYIVEGYRKCFIKKEWFFEDVNSLLFFIIILFILIIFTCKCYKRNKKNIVDLI